MSKLLKIRNSPQQNETNVCKHISKRILKIYQMISSTSANKLPSSKKHTNRLNVFKGVQREKAKAIVYLL